MANTLLALLFLATLATSIKIHRLHGLEALDSTHAYASTPLHQLSAQVADMHRQATDLLDRADSIQQKTLLISGGVVDNQDSLNITATEDIPEMLLAPASCEGMTEQQKSGILSNCNQTVGKLNSFLEKLATLNQTADTLNMKASANYQIEYLQTIEYFLNNNCSMLVHLALSAYQSNLRAPNWILGSQSVNDLVNQCIQRSRDNERVTNCPIQTPFFNGFECLNCTSESQVFNMETLLCELCPQGTQFVSSKKSCQSNSTTGPTPTISNPSAKDKILGPDPVPGANDVLCPETAPFFNGTNCINCPDIFNAATKLCVACQNGSRWNSTMDWCESDTVPLNPNQTNNTNSTGNQTTSPAFVSNPNFKDFIIGPDPVPTNESKVCPQEEPFFDGEQCIKCFSLFNSYTGGCVVCPENTAWNSSTDLCVSSDGGSVDPSVDPNSPTISNPAAADRIKGPDPVPTEAQVPCPVETPFFDGHQCLSCPEQFDASTGQCFACEAPAQWNPSTDSCAELISNLNNTQWISKSPYEAFVNNQNQLSQSGFQVCPDTTPFFKDKCISCPEGTYFNLDNTQCEACPTASHYDTEKHKCVLDDPAAITNPETAPNLVLSGTSQGEWNYIYNQTKQNNPDLQDCPSETPYYDGTTCIVCPSNVPYFDLHYQCCVSCPVGSEYDTGRKECINSQGDPLTPSLEKMASTVFAHHYRHKLDKI